MSGTDKIDVLLVDDRPDGLLALEAVLSSPGYNLVKAASGAEALSYLFDNECAVILMDVQMPGLDGFETAKLIRQHGPSRNTPIIFVTAINKEDHYVYKGYELGAVDYIFKPFEAHILRSKVAVFAELYRNGQLIRRQSAHIARQNTDLQKEIADRKAAQEGLNQSRIQLKALAAKLMGVQEEERRQISRELHDDLGQTLTCANLDLQRALKQDPDKSREIMESALRTVQKAQKRVRELSTMLRPPLMDDLGFKEAVHGLVSDFQRRTGADTRLVLQLENSDLSEAACMNIYRIIQEALNNIAKYAQASHVWVHITASEEKLVLRVKDDGVGCDVSAARGNATSMGLVSMRERAELLGGDFHIASTLGRGTDLHVLLPRPAAAAPKEPPAPLSSFPAARTDPPPVAGPRLSRHPH